MRRSVITGIGIVSCIGRNKVEVLESLKMGRSGISFNQSYKEIGMKSHVSGSIDINTSELIDRKILRFMGDASAYSYLSMQEAIEDVDYRLKPVHRGVPVEQVRPEVSIFRG